MMAFWNTVPLSKVKETWRFDAEYWNPEFLHNEAIIQKCATKKGYTVRSVYDFVRGIKGSAFYPTFVDYYSDRGMPFIRVADIGDFFLKEDRIVRIDPDVIRQYRQISVMSEGDIVLSKGGSIGEVAIIQEGLGQCALCRDVIALKSDESLISSFYLTAFLKSRFGQLQLDRNKSQQVQPHLTFPAVGEVQVVAPPRVVQDEIASLIIDANKKRQNSATLYTQAEELLISELGLGELNQSPTLFYEHDFSEIQQAARLDAEYFQPKYYTLLDAIRRTGNGRLLDDIVSHCARGLQPQYDEDGNVAVVNTKHMGKQFLSDDFERCSHETWTKQKRARLKQYDVLFYSTGAYIGRTNCWLSDEKAIGSNHVTIIRPNNECNPVYLALFMNSWAGLMQADRRAHGSAQREVYPNDLRSYMVYLPPTKKQKNLAQMVLDSKAALDESRRLLEDAKQMVEDAVLGGKC